MIDETNGGDMARTRGSRPVPDPTELTDRAIARLEKSLMLYIDGEVKAINTRLDGMDKATAERAANVKGIHEDIEAQVGHAKELINAEIGGHWHLDEERWAEMRRSSERESSANKVAIDAAFAAAEKTAALQEKANREAIDKSERATAETIKTNQESNRTETATLGKGLDEVKDRVTRIESAKTGGTESRASMYATIGVVVSIILFVIALVSFIAARLPVVG